MRLDAHQLRASRAGLPIPPPLPRRRNLESEMQRASVIWWRANCRHFGVPERLLFSIPNGFNADARRGSVMKAEGQRRGAPDLCLCVPRLRVESPAHDGQGNWKSTIPCHWDHALFLELKTPTGVLSNDQCEFHNALMGQGYKVVVCRTLAECINEITTYLTK